MSWRSTAFGVLQPATTTTSSILPPLQQPLRNLILLNNIHIRPPPTERIPIDSTQKRLTDRLKKLLRLQSLLPQSLTSTEQLIARRAADNKVLGKVDAPDTVEAADEWLARLRVESCDYGGYEPGPETLLVEGG